MDVTQPDPQAVQYNQDASAGINTGGGLPFGSPATPPGNYDFQAPGTPVPPTAIPNRAARVDFALGPNSPGVPSIIQTMRDGNEDQLRKQAMLQEQTDFVNHKHDMMSQLIQNSPNGVSPDEADFVNNLSLSDFNNYRDKDTILEQKFGERVVRSVFGADPNNTVSNAEAVHPEAVHQDMDIYEQEAAKQEILKKEVEAVRDAKSQQSWLGLGTDIAADMIPLWGTFKLTDAARRSSLTDLLPGDNVLDQVTYLRSIADPKEFQDKLHSVLQSIGNLQDREYFANAMGAYSISDRFLANVAGVADIATVGEALSPAIKGLGKASVKIASQITPDIGKAAAVAGNDAAAAEVAGQRILNNIPLRDQQTVEQKAWSIFNPTNWLTGDGADLTRTNVGDFTKMVNNNVAQIKDLLTNSPSVARVDDPTIQNVLSGLFQKMVGNDTNGLDRAVLDVDKDGKLTPRVEAQGPPAPINITQNVDPFPVKLPKGYGETEVNQDSLQAYVDHLSARFGIKDKITVAPDSTMSGGGNAGFKEEHGADTISYNPAVTDPGRVAAVVTHEFGHHLQKRIFQRATDAEINGLGDAYLRDTKAIADRNGLQFNEANAEASFAKAKTDYFWKRSPGSIEPGLPGTPQTVATNQDLMGILTSQGREGASSNTNYASQFHEWFANQVKAFLTTNQKATSISDKFIKKISDMWKSLYSSMTGKPAVGPEVKAFLEKYGQFTDVQRTKTVGYSKPLLAPAEGTRRAIDLQHNWLTNTESMHIRLGKMNGEQFSNKLSAQKFAKDYLGNHQLSPDNFVNQDGKWHIRLDVDLPDHLENYKDIIPDKDRISTSFLNRFIGNIRNQSNVLGEGISQARKVVTHGNQKLFDTFQQITKPIADLSSKERTKLSAILEQNRDYVDYTDPNNPQRGQFYKSLGDFQSAYHDKWNSLPSDKQIKAYYAYIQANQLDGMVRNAGWLRDNIRLGLKDWTDGDLKFRGKAVSAISEDRSSVPIHIAVKDHETGDIHYIYDKEKMGEKQRAIVDKALANNSIIVQPERGTVKIPGMEDKPGVSYYISPTPKENRLSLDTAWKDGGHVINDHRYYIKQPQVEDGWFKKDLAFATAPNEMVAKQRASAIEIARQMMLRNDPALDNFVSKNIGNGMDANAFKSNFFEGGFDKNTPFYHTPSGIQTVDYHKMEGVSSVRRHPYDQRQLDRSFSGERDPTNIAALIDEVGVKHVFQDGKLLDPFPALVRAAKSMVDVKLKRDYILKSATLWSDQFKDLLKPTDSQIGRDPLSQLYHPDYREHVDSIVKVNAENARKSILGFAGIRTTQDTMFDSFSSRMEQIAYKTLGDEKYRVASAYLAPLLKNPIQAAKSVAATMKLGLFSPAQLLMQAMSLVTVVSVSPRAGLRGMMAYMPLRTSMLSPTLAEHSVGMAGLLGWNRDHYREMMEAMHRSGWSFVHGDQAILDAISTPKIFQGKLGKAVDMGNIFLTEGVRAHRLPAFATAYTEWRSANPGEKMTRSVEHAVLSRADDLSNSMSAANNAQWQKGIIGLPAQFMTFPMRLAEGYWGKTFTPAERLRMFAGYSAMFGIPTAAAGAVGVWPMYESVKNYLLDNNIPHDDNAVQAILNGLPQTMVKMATGSNFDFGKRFGEGGVSQIRDAWYNDKSLWELATGAVGSITGDILSSSWPALKGIWSALTEDPKDRTYPLDIQDILHVFQNITSVNAGVKLWYAMNTQRWMSKYDQPMDGVTNPEAFVMALTGANLESIDEVFNEKEILKGRQDQDSKVMIQMGDLYRRALLSDDDKQREQYMTQAKALAVADGLPPDKWSRVMQQSFINLGVDQVDRVNARLAKDSEKRALTKGQ